MLRIFLLVTLSFCGFSEATHAQNVVENTTSAQSSNVLLGAFLPQQSPRLDDIVGHRNADEYFMPAWQAYKRGDIAGARVNAVIFLSTNGQNQEIYRGVVNGHKYVSVDRSAIKPSTLLCVAIAGQFVAYQQVAAGPGTMCQSDIDNDVRRGYGRSEASAIGVIAAVPAGR